MPWVRLLSLTTRQKKGKTMKKYTIQYRYENSDYKFAETKNHPKKWAIEEMEIVPETISRNSTWIFTGKTITGRKITFWTI